MAELLTHVLVGYALATGLSIRYDWITPEHVTMAMIGAAVPDLNRVGILLTSETVEAVLGVPFSWTGIHTLGGSLLAVCIGSLFVAPRERLRVFLLLALGMLSHHALDLLLVSATGHSYPVFWPLSAYHPPTPGIYLSTDRWPLAVATTVAAGVWYARYRLGPTGGRSTDPEAEPADRRER